jgi:hypothetical protein
MHINQMLVQCLEITMDHSLPQVELWSISKMSCNQPIWAQNWINSVWLEIFRIIKNPWRIRVSCNYKSCSKLHLLPERIFLEFFSTSSYSHLSASSLPLGLSHPVFNAKTRCLLYACPGSSCHTYGQNVSTEYQCLYYIISYYKKNLL